MTHRTTAGPRQAAVKIVTVLQQAGYTAYLAGGCVRDTLLGLVPKDYDVATDATPQQVASLFRRTQFVGEAFGVVLVKLLTHRVEVATFRTEWGYEDGRRPSEVHFSDAQHDAQRRDFTINGLFENPLAGPDQPRIIDYVGGQTDLERKIVRAIGNPDQRFDEDYLRLLRAVRFAARYDFAIESATQQAMARHAEKLAQISRERIGQEVQMMLTSPGRAQACGLLQQFALDGPALNEPAQQVQLLTLNRLAEQADYPTTLAAWLLDRHAIQGRSFSALPALLHAAEQPALQQAVRQWRDALCLSNHQRDQLRSTISALPSLLNWAALNKAKRKRLLAHPHWLGLLELLRAMAEHPPAEALARQVEADSPPLLEEGVQPSPLLTGDDLITMGHKPGPHFKSLIDAVYDSQLELRIHTAEQARQLADQLADHQTRR